MKLLDKLKNALFEEEYVEVEEKPKRKEIKKEEHVEKPIAKKIIQPEKEETKKVIEEKPKIEVEEDEYLGETLADKDVIKNDFKFPMMNDDDFEMEDKKPIEKEEEKVKPFFNNKFGLKKEKNLYHGKKATTESKPYGIEEIDIPEHEYGLYEKKEERTYFKPSPIISPIYGILDKNYKKEEIVSKKEIRLTSSYARENVNIDDVRKKAYGALEDDISFGVQEKTEYDEDLEKEIEEDGKLLDLSTDNDTPEVKKVTMGDAEEYFQDLGLEYNVDYKDTSKEKASGRRTKNDYEDIPEEKEIEIEEQITIKEPEIKEEKRNNDIDTDDDNLFDLIDSMYDKE